jgi:uncharacterized protein
MTHATHEPTSTALDVSALLGQPGATRPVRLAVAVPEGFEVPLTRFAGPEDAQVVVDGVLESLVEGVLLRGEVRASVAQQCAVCLVDLPPAAVVAAVDELYDDPAMAGDPDDVEPGYAIADERIDVDALIRDALAAEIPDAPRCRPDCAGLCPTCGTDRNHATCDCGGTEADPRWAALTRLDIPR